MYNLTIQALRAVAFHGPDEETRLEARAEMIKREELVDQAHTLVRESLAPLPGGLDAKTVRNMYRGEWPVIECGLYSLPLSVAIAHLGLIEPGENLIGDVVHVRVTMSDWADQPENWREYTLHNPGFTKPIEISKGHTFHKDNPKWISAIVAVVALIEHDPRVALVDQSTEVFQNTVFNEPISEDAIRAAFAKV